MALRDTAKSRTPRRVFGGMLRHYRKQAGLTRAELANLIFKSESLVQAIELGDRAATAEVAADLDAALQLNGALIQLREEMGDSMSYQAFPAWFQDWVSKEAEATRLRWFEPLVVPGLLQTEAYARAIIGTRFGLTIDEIEEQVAARLKRQEILAREMPPALWVVLDEWVLRRPVGGSRVMSEQTNRLIEVADRPSIVLQIISASVGAHDGTTGAFTIADFEDAASVGYQEGAGGGHPVEEPQGVALLELVWDTLRGEALPRTASRALLEETAKSWTSAT